MCMCHLGTSGFMIHNAIESLCLQDSSASSAVKLRRCNLDDDLQQWEWQEQHFLRNVGTQRCLSAFHEHPVVTVTCDGGGHLQWGCENHRLLSLNNSLELSTKKGRLRLTPALGDPGSKWKSLDKGDVCQERLRSRRAWDEFEEEFEEDTPAVSSMNQEQREYLQWIYRTEDQTKWTFAMLALAFAALLLGAILLVTGMMGSRSRKKIAKYKAVARALKAPVEEEELQVITEVRESKEAQQVLLPLPLDLRLPTATATITGAPDIPAPSSLGENGLRPGDIVVTWKDGTVSSLYGGSGAGVEEAHGDGEVAAAAEGDAEVEREGGAEEEELTEVVEVEVAGGEN
ncbi:hypothetical protein ACEWY4_026549 [Coilia grayii]|uniref:Ricin B lectin domain-containing protein n=1 Tax=Coilia grayii TaxID=363190 RepID=A0ABD1IPV5_9TELE